MRCASILDDIDGGAAHADDLHAACKGNAFWMRQGAICAALNGTWDFIGNMDASVTSAYETFCSLRLKSCSDPHKHILYAMAMYGKQVSAQDLKNCCLESTRKSWTLV